MLIPKNPAEGASTSAYFAASNSRDGFRSYYETVFRGRVDRLYCIKGGPGTGKSTLMRRVARLGEAQGWQVELYYCSSDAASLDAVLVWGPGGSFGLLDATAPHVFEPTLPGAAEDILDLGQFWDSALLAARKSDIRRLGDQKSDGYRMAYRYLSAAGELSDILRDTATPCLSGDKLTRTVHRLCADLPSGRGPGQVRVGLRSAIGMGGRTSLDSYIRLGQRVCLIENDFDTAYLLTRLLADRAADSGHSLRISYHPVLPDRIDALLLEEEGTLFIVCDPGERERLLSLSPRARVVRMRRLMIPERLRSAREDLRATARLRETMLEGACRCLADVSRAHFALEKIYAAAMDFGAKERYCDALCRRLLASVRPTDEKN